MTDYQPQSFSEACNLLRRVRDELKDTERKLAAAIEDADTSKREAMLSRWMVRGIVSEKANIRFTYNTFEPDVVLEAARIFGQNAANELLILGKMAFQDHARMKVMRDYIYYLQNHASSRGVQFVPLEDHTVHGGADIFSPDWKVPVYAVQRVMDYIKDQPVQNTMPERNTK